MSVSDNFNRANGSFGSNWTDTTLNSTAPQVFSNEAWNNVSSQFAMIFWAAAVNTFNATQSSQIKITTSTTYVGPAVRCAGSAGSTNGYVYFSHGSLQKCVSGAFTAIASPSAGVVNGTLKLSVTWNGSTNTLTPNKDGVDGSTTTDSSVSGATPGAAGIGWYSNGAGADDFLGTGEIAAGGNSSSVSPSVSPSASVSPSSSVSPSPSSSASASVSPSASISPSAGIAPIRPVFNRWPTITRTRRRYY